MKILLLVISFSLTLPTTAGEATEPVAIVEEASADAPVKTFSYLSQGQIINLGPKAELLIGFLRSCVQERVRGGVVKIGADRSHVTNGQRSAKLLDCGGAAKLSRAESERGAALVMRKPPVPAPKIRLTSTTPFIAPRHPTLSVHLKRLDRRETAVKLKLQSGVADLAALGIALRRGGIYRIKAGTSSTVVKIAPDAQAGGGSILVRLLSF